MRTGAEEKYIDRAFLIERDRSSCYLCGVLLDEPDVTVDHIVPLGLGGRHVPENLAVACGTCNFRKAARLLPGLEASCTDPRAFLGLARWPGSSAGS